MTVAASLRSLVGGAENTRLLAEKWAEAAAAALGTDAASDTC